MLTMYNKHYLQSCVRLFLQVFQNKPYNRDFLNINMVTDYLTQLTNSYGFLGFVYYKNNVIVGFCFGVINSYFEDSIFELKEILVSNVHQNKGIGKSMLKDLEEYLLSKNIDTITLNTKEQLPAYSLYLKNGYTQNKNIVTMSKKLR